MTGSETGLHALVLAAGTGRRFGGGKLLAPYRGRPLIEGALAAAAAAPVDGVVVVVGADAERVAGAVRAFGAARPIRIVEAERWAEGISASLQAGVAALPRSAAGAFIFLGDMPETPPSILAPLVRAVLAGASAAAPVHDGRRGHPVVLGPALLLKVPHLRGDQGARALLDALGQELALVPSEHNGVLFDVDRREDLDVD